MKTEEIISTLQLDMDLFLFDTFTGEEKNPNSFKNKEESKLTFGEKCYLVEENVIKILSQIESEHGCFPKYNNLEIRENIQEYISVLNKQLEHTSQYLTNDLNIQYYNALKCAIDKLKNIDFTIAIARQDLKVGNKDCLNKLAQYEDTGVDVIRLLDVPESDRERLAKNFEETIDTYLKAKGLLNSKSKDDDFGNR